MEYEVEGTKLRGRPKKIWREDAKKDCQACKLNKENAVDHSRWRKLMKDGWWSGQRDVKQLLLFFKLMYKLLANFSNSRHWTSPLCCPWWVTLSTCPIHTTTAWSTKMDTQHTALSSATDGATATQKQAVNLLKSGHVVFELCEQTDRHTHKHVLLYWELFFDIDDMGLRGHDSKPFKRRFRLDVRKFVFSNRVITTTI